MFQLLLLLPFLLFSIGYEDPSAEDEAGVMIIDDG